MICKLLLSESKRWVKVYSRLMDYRLRAPLIQAGRSRYRALSGTYVPICAIQVEPWIIIHPVFSG